ncbi:hypothetical protein [Actinoplanes sp. NBRC 101535]|uniref:hypothetical protein n=1 Tax=Actinoplanes sp. NBRC 101535 TaxID=3032196 RepID=UPI0024A16992|nr:hypothetical protein [Actinoplanes sp. NBRC 101535]GLY03466.1 hypothetical protein Acsp01_38450 [Actinoplanes sp. NBRC 101535]
MPSFDLMALPASVVRALIVAVAHIPIVILACYTVPVWMVAVWRPATHGRLGLHLVRELHAWSHDVIRATGGRRRR